jgi:hypothetical protein
MTRPAYLIRLSDRCTQALMLHMAVGETDVEYPFGSRSCENVSVKYPSVSGNG